MEYYMLSNTGGRDINEDYIDTFEIEGKRVFVLADGLGGHGHGEIASQEASEAVKKHISSDNQVDADELLKESFQSAHLRLKELQRQIDNTSFFKTTLVLLMIKDDYFVWGHIGDSRLYHFEQNKLIERSMDHSVPQMLVNAGKIKERQIRHHEDRSRLTKVVGSDEEIIKPFITGREPHTSQTAFLLCSDGFWEFIDEKKMQKELKKAKSPKEWLCNMEKTVIKNGKGKTMDNYSAIAVFI